MKIHPVTPIVACLSAVFAVGTISDALVEIAQAESKSAAALVIKEAECDALADQLDSAVAELHAAGALLEKHGLKLHDDSNLIEQ